MPRKIEILVYSVDESCQLLADRTNWPNKYSREELYRLIKQYLPDFQKAGKRYFLTDVDLSIIEKELKTEKRRKVY